MFRILNIIQIRKVLRSKILINFKVLNINGFYILHTSTYLMSVTLINFKVTNKKENN